MEKNENRRFYDQLRSVPDWAKKTIAGGRLKGFTDIRPQWRIEKMTEVFGPCGIGWKYEIVKFWAETVGETILSFAQIDLYVRIENEWSEPIPGIGGSQMTSMEKNGLYVSDECYKMALTDALSVAMKALGVAADVYNGIENTKYEIQEPVQSQSQSEKKWLNEAQFNATMQCTDIKKIESVLKNFSIRREWKEKIIEYIETLKTQI